MSHCTHSHPQFLPPYLPSLHNEDIQYGVVHGKCDICEKRRCISLSGKKISKVARNKRNGATSEPDPILSPRIIQCLTCAKLHCPTHFKAHEHHIGLEIHFLLYHCNICGHYFPTLRDDSEHRIEQHYQNGNHLNVDDSRRRRDASVSYSTSFEFRGLINMGNTCFMNAVLQALVHNPMLRNFMLTYAVPLLQDQPVRCENFMILLEKEQQEFAERHLNSHTAITDVDDPDTQIFQSKKRTRSLSSPIQQQPPRSYKEIPAIGVIGQTPQRKRRRIMRKSQKVNGASEDDNSFDGSSPVGADHVANGQDQEEHESISDNSTPQFPVLPTREFSQDFIKKHISIGTELQNLVQESYSAKKSPITPNDFLYVVWKSAGHLAGYRQQDAHEFLMAVLNGLSNSPPFSNVADFIFRGKLESRLDCRRCNYTSSTTDPFLDISLHLKAHSMESGAKEKPFSSLHECLQRYTRQELLDNEYKCPACRSQGSCTKRLSFKKLPIVSCLHLKRFETHHMYGGANGGVASRRRGGGGTGPTKIDDFIDFPLELDFFPFTSTHIHDHVQESDVNTQYELFAVVEHFGGMNSGHYICYVKRDNQWHLCDDETVRLSTEKQVEKCRAYILFYTQKELQFGE